MRTKRNDVPGSTQIEDAIDAVLSRYPTAVRELVLEARKTLQKWLPSAEETVDTSAKLLGYSYGSGYKGLVCTLLLSQTGVKLGLNKGAELEDSHGLLRGSGKVHRYVQLRSPKDLKQAGLRALVEGARALCLDRLKAPSVVSRK